MIERRLFLGNLPNDISESSIEKLLNEYKVSKIDVKRKKILDEESVFAFVNIPADNVNKCLSELQDKKWKGCNLKIELARESFIDRLKKEHSEKNQQNDTKSEQLTSNSFMLRQNLNGGKNKRIKFDSDNEGEESESINVIDRTVYDVPRRRNLPMFRGTASVIESDIKSIDSVSKQNTNKKADIKNSINNAYSTMKSFEAFSDVWKDEPAVSHERKFNPFEEQRKPLLWKISRTNDDHTENEAPTYNNNKSRKISCDTRDRVQNEGTKRNISNNYNNNRTWKTSPSKINDVEEEMCTPNVDKKEKVLKWKSSKLNEEKTSDDRFKLDEKFFDDEEGHSFHSKQKHKTTNNKVRKNGVTNEVFEHRQLVRYDPTRPEHKVLEMNSFKSSSLIDKKKSKKKPEKHETDQKSKEKGKEKSEPVKPAVSKEKHYKVVDTLVNGFKKTESSSEFRLSSLFDQKIKQENPSLPKQQTIDVEMPLDETDETDSIRRDSSSEDEVEVEPPAEILPARASEKILGKCGVWGETFFFKEDDSRFKEALDFFEPEDMKKIIDFDKQRVQLRTIVRKKLQNSKRDNRLFKQKLGDKLNKSKFKMRLKKAGNC